MEYNDCHRDFCTARDMPMLILDEATSALDSEGLEYISNKHGLQKKDMYVIGDRYSHDGLCAENFGCNYLILSKYRIFRMWQYRKIL